MPNIHAIRRHARDRRLRITTVAGAVLIALWLGGPLATTIGALESSGQPEHATAPGEHAAGQPAATEHAAGPAAEGAHGEAAEHNEESLVSFLSRIANFVILVGGLYYLLHTPIRQYLDARGEQIRAELQQAAATKVQATRSLADIEAQLKALPAELEALKARGKDEIAAEQVRMAKAADIERTRLVEQARREIDRQLQIAKRDLTEHAADLAVGVARARLSREMTHDDQLRLVDRYVGELGGRGE